MKYTRKTTYYRQVTHEFNLPAGWSCPWAENCLTKADRATGKRVATGTGYVCYAAVAERFPSVRGTRWANFEAVREHLRDVDGPFPVPRRATHVRIHGSGDFFSQAYFDRWLTTARAHPDVKFWAFTKSIGYWVARLGEIPPNLELQASRGSKQDELIDRHGLKCSEVFATVEDVPPGMWIDTDDLAAQTPGGSFALVDNFTTDPDTPEKIARHNLTATHPTKETP